MLYMYIYILKLVYMLYSYFISEKSIDQNVLIGFLVSLCSIALSKAHRTVPNCNTEGNFGLLRVQTSDICFLKSNLISNFISVFILLFQALV